MTPQDAALINEAVRRVILRTHAADSCIASVFVLREVLRIGFNLEVHPRVVTATIYNRSVTRGIEEGSITTVDQIVAAVREPQGWSVGIGFGGQAAVDAKKWAGHLVGITKHPTGYLLWDPSLDQASRPHHDMTLTPLVELLPQDIYSIPETRLVVNECFTVYCPKPEGEHILTTSPDWVDRERFNWHLKTALETLGRAGIKLGGPK